MASVQHKNLCSIFLRNLPRHVRDQFKAWCAKRGTNMTEEITRHMRELIDKENALLLADPSIKKPEKEVTRWRVDEDSD